MKKNLKIRAYCAFTVAIVLLLSGCSSGIDDLEVFVLDQKKKHKGSVQPLPPFEPYTSYEFRNPTRDPFAPQRAVELIAKPQIDENALSPDSQRRKEPLEFFPIDSLVMVGTLEQNGVTWGLIRDSEGAVHRVTNGNYVGQDFGEITEITESSVTVTELRRDENGLWNERVSKLLLGE